MDKNKGKNIRRRIGAIILLVLFVLLLLNIFIFKLYEELSLGIYVLILVYFLFFTNKGVHVEDTDEDNLNKDK